MAVRLYCMTDEFKEEIRSRMGAILDAYINDQAQSKRVSDGSECVLTESGRKQATHAALWMYDVGQYIMLNGPISGLSLPQDEPNFGSLADEQRKEARSKGRGVLRDGGWTRVGKGSVRDVWKPPEDAVMIDDPTGCVVKIARWSERDYDAGVDQNRQELANWMIADRDAKQFLTPPSEYDSERHRWFTVPTVDTDVKDSEVEAFIERLESSGWSLLDLRNENVGRFNGQIVILDAGIVYPPDSRELSNKKNDLSRNDPGNTLGEFLET